jgi:hypothetical protein
MDFRVEALKGLGRRSNIVPVGEREENLHARVVCLL